MRILILLFIGVLFCNTIALQARIDEEGNHYYPFEREQRILEEKIRQAKLREKTRYLTEYIHPNITADTTGTVEGVIEKFDLKYTIQYKNGKKHGVELWLNVTNYINAINHIEKCVVYSNGKRTRSLSFNQKKLYKELVYLSSENDYEEIFYINTDTYTDSLTTGDTTLYITKGPVRSSTSYRNGKRTSWDNIEYYYADFIKKISMHKDKDNWVEKEYEFEGFLISYSKYIAGKLFYTKRYTKDTISHFELYYKFGKINLALKEFVGANFTGEVVRHSRNIMLKEQYVNGIMNQLEVYYLYNDITFDIENHIGKDFTGKVIVYDRKKEVISKDKYQNGKKRKGCLFW